jgi:uncharacterized delta-60 repeat protein
MVFGAEDIWLKKLKINYLNLNQSTFTSKWKAGEKVLLFFGPCQGQICPCKHFANKNLSDMKNTTLCFLLLLLGHFSTAQSVWMDTSFAAGGTLNTNLGNTNFPYGKNFVLTPDGGLGVVGRLLQQFYVYRFDGNGVFLPHLATTVPDWDYYSKGITIQEDGKIIAAARDNIFQVFHLHLVRINHDGSIDSTFGVNGIASTHTYFGSTVNLQMQSDGKILVFGIEQPDVNVFWPTVIRFEANGAIDTTFGNNGYARYPVNDNVSMFHTCIELPDGRLLFGGSANIWDALFMQMTPDGLLDSSFGQNGYFIETFEGYAESYGMIRLPDGRFISAGYTNPGYKAYVARFLPNGDRDTTFGDQGVIYYPEVNESVDILQLPDGKMLTLFWISDAIDQTILCRLHPDGQVDTTFGAHGYFNLPDTDQRPRAIVLKDNQVYVSTQKESRIYIHRLLLDLNVGILQPEMQADIAPLIYPNPVGEQCTLQFTLTEKSALSIVLYDIQGKPIRSFHNNEVFEAGEHSLQLDFPAAIPAGNYLIRLEMKGKTAKTMQIFR